MRTGWTDVATGIDGEGYRRARSALVEQLRVHALAVAR